MYVLVADARVRSRIVTATLLNVPLTVGVPEIVPVRKPIDNPGGRLVAVHVNGGVPPAVGLTVKLYGRPCSPFGRDPVAMPGAGLMTIEYSRAAVAPAASSTVTVTAYVPAAAGAPDITPLTALMERPPGRPLAVQANGDVPLARVIVWAG